MGVTSQPWGQDVLPSVTEASILRHRPRSAERRVFVGALTAAGRAGLGRRGVGSGGQRAGRAAEVALRPGFDGRCLQKVMGLLV